MTSINIDVNGVSTLLEGSAIIEHAHRNCLILIAYLTHSRCRAALALEGKWNHLARRRESIALRIGDTYIYCLLARLSKLICCKLKVDT